MSSLDENLNRPILADPVCGHEPQTIESISKLLFSIWKQIDFQGFLGIETFLRRGGGAGGLKETSKGRFWEKLTYESSLNMQQR